MPSTPKGPRLTIVTNAGGPGVLATDALLTSGGKLAKLSDSGLERLNAVVQQRSCFPEAGQACSAGASMESRGLCYPGAMCTCGDDLTWRCARP